MNCLRCHWMDVRVVRFCPQCGERAPDPAQNLRDLMRGMPLNQQCAQELLNQLQPPPRLGSLGGLGSIFDSLFRR